MSRVGAVLGVLLLATSASALLYFEATITVSYDPDMRGSLTGSMWYQYDASDTTQNYKKISYVLSSTSGSSSTYTQIYNYTSGTSYLKCPSECTASMITSSIEVLTMQSGESKSSSSSTCAAYTRSSSTSDTVVTTIAFDNQGLPCYIIYGTGRRIDFTITKSSSTAASSSTWSYSSWGCPARTCNSVMDLVIIVDVSGSINDVAWASLKAFLAKLATAFDISTTATNVGVVAFSTDSELVLDLSSDSDEVQDAILYDIPRMQKRTCIGCGIYTTIDSYDRVTQSRKNLNPKNVTIMITDGGNNQCPGSTKTSVTHAYMKAAISQLKAAPYNDLSIIVAVKGDDYNPTYLLELASNASYEIPVSSYETLMTVIDKVITVTCQDYPSSPCGSNCYGFCACSGTCLCPNLCSTGGNQCINSTCSSISGVTACWNSSISCNDGKACTIDTCDTSSGCVHTMQACACVPADCDDNNWCTVDACNVTTAGSNCTHSNTTCDDGNPCTVDSCDATNKKCTHTNYCDDGLYCTDDVCTASTDLKSATCTHSSITCTMNSTLNTTDKTYRCYKALCNETAKCHWEFVASTAKCSGCRKGANSTSETCIGALTVAEAAAVLSVAAVAGIIVAAVIGFMIFSAVSAAGTYKLIKMMKDNNTMAATNNPMYKPSDSESVNPAYAQR